MFHNPCHRIDFIFEQITVLMGRILNTLVGVK